MRGLSDAFMASLQTGELAGLLRAVKLDDTLCLEIRGEYINVYYRGGCLFKVSCDYTFAFDESYFGKKSWPFGKPATTEEWLSVIPQLKAAIDSYFCRGKDKSEQEEHGVDKAEREVQQMILRDNTNSRIANETDYFITDIEYTGQGFRFDMVAAKWLAGHRQWGYKAGLSIIEVKYGDKSLDERPGPGLYKHTQDVIALLEDEEKLRNLIDETNTLANQKRMLGLFPQLDARNTHEIAIPEDCKKEFIFILVNTNPRSKKLKEVLEAIQKDGLIRRLNELGCKLLLARASCMGYGLYAECMEEIKAEIQPEKL